MKEVGAFEAKTHLVVENKARLSHQEIVEGMRALRERAKPGKRSVKDRVNKGRRF